MEPGCAWGPVQGRASGSPCLEQQTLAAPLLGSPSSPLEGPGLGLPFPAGHLLLFAEVPWAAGPGGSHTGTLGALTQVEALRKEGPGGVMRSPSQWGQPSPPPETPGPSLSCHWGPSWPLCPPPARFLSSCAHLGDHKSDPWTGHRLLSHGQGRLLPYSSPEALLALAPPYLTSGCALITS